MHEKKYRFWENNFNMFVEQAPGLPCYLPNFRDDMSVLYVHCLDN